MNYFRDILGNEAVIEHFQTALRLKNISHAYLLSGEDGSGKLLLATAFASAMQCEAGGIEPCGRCRSCLQEASGNHPDIFFVTHEKSMISVDDIREQVTSQIAIKPYSSPYKLFIIDEAEKMNDQAQNALLKTLEEPPEYAVILLLAANENNLLVTIRSRCIQLATRPLTNDVIQNYLMEHFELPNYQAELAASFSCGNLGKAIRYASSPEFSEQKDALLHLFRRLDNMTTSDIIASVRPLAEDKNTYQDELDLILLWFRDILLFKASQDVNVLIYRNEINDIRHYATTRSFEALERVIEGVETARQRLRANVKPETVFELLLLRMRDEQ